MPFTLYAYLGLKHTRRPILTVDKIPSDWLSLRLLVEEACFIIWNEHHTGETILSLERHLGGAYRMRWRRSGYSPRRIHFKRTPEFSCRTKFDHLTGRAKLSAVSFGPSLLFAGVLDDYRRIEKGIWKSPASVIPKSDQDSIGDTKSLLLQPSACRYNDYAAVPKLIYGKGLEERMKHLSYERFPTRSYMPKPQQLEELNEEQDDET